MLNENELKIILEGNKNTELVIRPRGYMRCEIESIEEYEKIDIISEVHVSLCNTINLFNDIYNKNIKQSSFDKDLDRHLRRIENNLNNALCEFHKGLISRSFNFDDKDYE